MSFVCTAKSLGRIFRGVSCAPAAVEFGTVLLRNVFVMVGSRSSLPPPLVWFWQGEDQRCMNVNLSVE